MLISHTHTASFVFDLVIKTVYILLKGLTTTLKGEDNFII